MAAGSASASSLARRARISASQQHLEAGVDQVDAVEDGLQLGGLVDHVHRGRDLAAVVQQAGQPQFAAVGVVHAEPRQRPAARRMRGLGQHHGQLGHELAVTAGVRRFFVDADVDQVDQGFEQAFELLDQLLVGQRHRGLGRQGFDEALVGLGEGADRAALAVLGIDQLEHAHQLALVVGHRHRQEGLRVVAEGRVEGAHAGEIEDVRLVHVLDVDRLVEVGRVGRHRGQVLVAVGVVQRHRLDVDRLAAHPALVDLEAVVDRNVEAQVLAVLARAVQGAAIGVGHLLGHAQDAVEQRGGVAVAAERDADLGKLVQALRDLGRVQLFHVSTAM